MQRKFEFAKSLEQVALSLPAPMSRSPTQTYSTRVSGRVCISGIRMIHISRFRRSIFVESEFTHVLMLPLS